MSASARICLIEDDPIMGESLHRFFGLEGLPCDWFRDLGSARAALRQQPYQVLVSDIRLPDGTGEDLFRESVEAGPGLPPTLFITAYGSVEQAVELVRLGACDYLTKPFDLDELMVKLRRHAPVLFAPIRPCECQPRLGISPAMARIEALLHRLAGHLVPVLIEGESGVGKEYGARLLHECSGPARPFVALNCAAIPAELLEAELFGAERGAYTGAVETREGLFQQAGEGTLFLDEIGEMPLTMQTKLLRVVQERCLRRVGGRCDLPVRARLVWATNRDLRAEVAAGRFRADLYYRISTVRLEIPPLRERPADIAWFAELFLDDFAHAYGRRHRLSPAARAWLERQPWPGNVRQLRQAIERAAIFAETEVIESTAFAEGGPPALAVEPQARPRPLKDYLGECERWYIRQALAENQGRIQRAAEWLGISRKGLWERMRRLGMGPPS